MKSNQMKMLVAIAAVACATHLPAQDTEKTAKRAAKAERNLSTWLKDYIPAKYPDATIEDHGGWAQAHVPGDLVVSWAQWNEKGITLKGIEAHALKDGRSIFVSKGKKEGWGESDSVVYFEGAGYYVASYASATMSDWGVEKSTVIQFDGDAKKFSEDMAKAWASGRSVESAKVEQWGVYEVSLHGPADGNPYIDVAVGAEFNNGSHAVTVPGFYDGSGVYRVRFSPDRAGQWKYVTKSDRAELNGQSGSFVCIKATGKNHGPIRPVNTHYLEYADGSPYYCVGTTSYQWTSVKQSIQEKTVETLAKSPFNKMRMCVFPKRYSYGNDTEPWMLPFKRKDDKNDPSQPNYEFFQNFDKRVGQLMEMGIQADVILFHPYDNWGYYKMGKEMNERYVRHMIARLSAYRNVWWSLANEWDVPRTKNEIDWEGIGNLLQSEDPHQRLRGIHNWYYDESHFYDHTRPWITHVSAQTYFFFNAIKWRNKYKKPLLYDEMRYEGDVQSGWGKLTAKEMTSYFWKAGLSGVYGTHGDTFKNDSDTETEVRWWAKGGMLMGKSPDRIAFFKKVMEEAPVTEMTPHFVKLSDESIPEHIPDKNDGKLITALNNGIYTLSKQGEHYLSYTEDPGRTIKLNLAGDQDFTLQVIDTWNMKFISEESVGSGKFEFETKIPFTALRLVSKKTQSTAANAEEPEAGAPYSPYPDKVIVTKVRHFDNMCWKIAAAGGTWYFENGETDGKSGFSSAFDQAGNDWIGNDADRGYNKSPNTGGRHEYRGWPNFGEGNFDHPQRKSGAKTRWVDADGKDVPFASKLEGDHLIMRSANSKYELEYHFFPSHAAIKVLKADDKYAFLFEGPIGGEQEASVEKDYYVLKDGKHRECKTGGLGYLEPEFGNKFPSPFFYLADSDPKDTQVFYAGVKDTGPETAGDEGWRQGRNMVIFSYGRDEDKRAYTGTDAVCVFGFLQKASGHEAISSFIEARLVKPFRAP